MELYQQKGTVTIMKKLLSVFIAVSIMFSLSAGIVKAESAECLKTKVEIHNPSKMRNRKGGFVPAKSIPSKTVEAGGPMLFSNALTGYDYWEVYDFIETQLRAHSSQINLYNEGYRITEEEGMNIFRAVLYDNYDIFVLDFGMDYDCDSYCLLVDGTDYLYGFVPGYYYEELENGEAGAKAMMDQKINGYLAAASDIPSDDVVGKLIVIHDAVCADIDYAEEELAAETENEHDNHLRTVYDAFKTGRTVCQGYALVFKTVCDALNEQLKSERQAADPTYTGTEDIIETVICSSDWLDHMWVILKFDGEWYHVDPTWADMDGNVQYDDPTICSIYDFFLRSDHSYLYPDDPDNISSHAIPGETEGEIYTDWCLYTDGTESITCDSEKYAHGYIFNRIPYGMISHSGGFYNIDFWGFTYLSEGIVATKVLATAPYVYPLNGSNYNAVVCMAEYSMDEDGNDVFATVPYRQILVSYDNGIITNVTYMKTGTLSYDKVVARNSSSCKMFLWSPDMTEPLCRVIDLTGLE